ncbi:hypothetical protein [Streptomyces sp. NPDC015414]|uniref:hypothetical protein n=1 Tax=Streptomyces sp. NPDC015414 TaxID=3364957 RepID=UPI0036F66D0C
MSIEDGTDIELSHLQIGEVVGSGGQGEVLEIAGTDLLCKRYRNPSRTNGEALATLAAFRQRLTPWDRSFLDSVAAWPLCRVTREGRSVGFLMRRAPAPLSWRTPQGTTRLLELQYLIRPSKAGFRTVPQPTPMERRSLALACVRVVDWFHRRGVVLGDISHANVLWGLDPEPRVHFLDCDGFRPLGGVAVQSATDTPDWSDPLTPASRHDFDSDAYKTALTIGRILTRTPYVTPGQRLDLVPGCLDEHQEAVIRKLFTEAAGDRRTRPVLSEWLHVLRDRDSDARPMSGQAQPVDAAQPPTDMVEFAEPPPTETAPPATGVRAAAKDTRDRKPINLRVSGR